MIRIIKPYTAPSKLLIDGQLENAINCAAYDANPISYINGPGKFKIKKSIYGHKTVKRLLLGAQHQKCCFCEKNQRDEPGAIEHFRPKNGYLSQRGEKRLRKPGYYWLAYDWNNLYFVCHPCNTSYKKNLFPLRDSANRARSHHDDISLESPLLLDPGGAEDPRNHIVFDNDVPRGISVIGRETILICGLDRAALNEDRKEWLKELKHRILLLLEEPNLRRQTKERAIKYLKDAQRPEKPYSSAAFDYINQFPDIVRLLAN
jgi:uncharacterized protein (TIGR02646 family)